MLGSVWRFAGFCGVLVFVFAAAIGSAQKSPAESVTAELPAGPMQAKATTACTECHEARIIAAAKTKQSHLDERSGQNDKMGCAGRSGRPRIADRLSEHELQSG